LFRQILLRNTHTAGANMTLRLYTSWFSTFARKVALAMELKGLQYEAVDALKRDFRPELLKANWRAEVPVLFDDDLVIVNSSDILQYLEQRYPEPAIFPAAIADRVLVRTLERLADQRFDAIVVDCSFWAWAERPDEPPPGLLAAGQQDLEQVLSELDDVLSSRPQPWPFGAPGVVECAFFPNLAAARPLGFTIDELLFPAVLRWLEAMRQHPTFAHDRRRTAEFLKQLGSADHERQRLFWSGDRLEWLLSRGFHQWFATEIAHDRVAFPGTPAEAAAS
jgi:glutathione S-transferase